MSISVADIDVAFFVFLLLILMWPFSAQTLFHSSSIALLSLRGTRFESGESGRSGGLHVVGRLRHCTLSDCWFVSVWVWWVGFDTALCQIVGSFRSFSCGCGRSVHRDTALCQIVGSFRSFPCGCGRSTSKLHFARLLVRFVCFRMGVVGHLTQLGNERVGLCPSRWWSTWVWWVNFDTAL